MTLDARLASAALLAGVCAIAADRAPAQQSLADDRGGAAPFTRICNSGEAAGSGACPVLPALGAGAADWGCTRDHRSALVWELKTADGGPRDRDKTFTNFSADYDPSRGLGNTVDAAGYVAAVNARGSCGGHDWRLPTRLELLRLEHSPGRGGWFPNPPSVPAKRVHWSATPYAGDKAHAWAVDLNDGSAGDDHRSLYHALRLVRGAAPAAPQFVVAADGLEVSDSRGGLVWRRCAEGATWNGSSCAGRVAAFNHAEAVEHARQQAASSGGSGAWRLPTLIELATIVDDRRVDPAIDPALIPATPGVWFWSATPSAANAAYAWAVQFAQGHAGPNGFRHDAHAARLVRVEK